MKEVKMVNWNAKFFLCVCVREEKSWNIEPNDTKNFYFLIRKVLKYWQKKKNVFNFFVFNVALEIILILFANNALLSRTSCFPTWGFYFFIYIYIYIDIDIDIDWRWSFSQCLTDNKLQLNIIWSSKRFKLVNGI